MSFRYNFITFPNPTYVAMEYFLRTYVLGNLLGIFEQLKISFWKGKEKKI